MSIHCSCINLRLILRGTRCLKGCKFWWIPRSTLWICENSWCFLSVSEMFQGVPRVVRASHPRMENIDLKKLLIDRWSHLVNQPAILLAQLLISRSELSFKNPTGVGGKASCKIPIRIHCYGYELLCHTNLMCYINMLNQSWQEGTWKKSPRKHDSITQSMFFFLEGFEAAAAAAESVGILLTSFRGFNS